MTEQWKVGEGYASFFVQDSRGHTIFQTPSKELAEQIVREHNAHEPLVEAFAEKLAEKFSGILGKWEDMNDKTKDEYRKLAIKLAEETEFPQDKGAS